jgi:hypothetical protein
MLPGLNLLVKASQSADASEVHDAGLQQQQQEKQARTQRLHSSP